MKRALTFLSGMMVMLLLLALPTTALAASGAIHIEVNPISVMVNGKLFQPKDANGNSVMVFTYNGTTYAPLRALAEAYGLEVGYDAQKNVATVNKPTTAITPTTLSDTYADFEQCWTITEKPVTNYGNEKIFIVNYSGNLSMSDFKTWWKSMGKETCRAYAEQLGAEIQRTVPGYTVTAYFSFGQYPLGSVHAAGGYTGSNFDVASAWIR